MSSLSRIFTVVDDQPEITPIGINIPCFTKLWKEDTTDNKSNYSKWLGYIFHMSSYESPYYDAKNKQAVVAKSFMDDEDFHPNKTILDCIEECKQREYTSELRSVDAAMSLSDSIGDTAQALKQESDKLNKLIKEIDFEMDRKRNIDEKIALMKSKQELEKAAVDKAQKAAALISTLQKSVDEIGKLRKSAMASLKEKEQDNKDAISNFMIDQFVDQYS